jgi:hypothetical protein
MLLADGAIGACRQKNKFLVRAQVKIARVPIAAPLIPLVSHWDLVPNIQICQHQTLFVKDQSATVASGANVVNLILSAAQTFAI